MFWGLSPKCESTILFFIVSNSKTHRREKEVINLKLNMCLYQCVSFELDWYGP